MTSTFNLKKNFNREFKGKDDFLKKTTGKIDMIISIEIKDAICYDWDNRGYVEGFKITMKYQYTISGSKFFARNMTRHRCVRKELLPQVLKEAISRGLNSVRKYPNRLGLVKIECILDNKILEETITLVKYNEEFYSEIASKLMRNFTNSSFFIKII
jgi:hypothetical protein